MSFHQIKAGEVGFWQCVKEIRWCCNCQDGRAVAGASSRLNTCSCSSVLAAASLHLLQRIHAFKIISVWMGGAPLTASKTNWGLSVYSRRGESLGA